MTDLDQRCREAIAKHSTDALDTEIQYQLEVEREDGELPLYTILGDIEDDAERDENRPMITALRRILIELGTYAEVTEDELARTQSTGKKYAFQLGGKKYNFNAHPEGARR